MITTLIISAVILLYWLSGFLPGRAIKPKNNRWHAWGPFYQVWGFIDGDKPSLLPKSMPWPFNKVFITLTYNKFVEDNDLTEHTSVSNEGKTIHYHKVSEIIHGIKNQVRKVTEEVTRLRKVETHPYIVKIPLPKTGGTFFLVFTIKIDLKNPTKILKLDEFLIFIGNQLHDKVFPWAVAYEKKLWEESTGFSEEKQKNTIIDTIIGLNIDNDSQIMVDVEKADGTIEKVFLRKYMNMVVKDYGGLILERSIDLDVGYDEKIKKILDTRNEQINQGEVTKLEEEKSLTRDKIREREKKDELQVIELEKKENDDIKIPLIQAEAEASAKANKAWGEGGLGTLMIGEQKSGVLINPTKNTKKQGGENATT